MANCPVKLTGNTGGVVEATTDAEGKIALDQIEADTYTISIANTGYNIYNGTWMVNKDGGNDYTVQLTRPVMTLSDSGVTADMAAESLLQKPSLSATMVTDQ